MIETAPIRPVAIAPEQPSLPGLVRLSAPSILVVRTMKMAEAILDSVPARFKLTPSKMEAKIEVDQKFSPRSAKDIVISQYKKEYRKRSGRSRRCASCGNRHISYEQCQGNGLSKPQQFRVQKLVTANINKLHNIDKVYI